MIDYETDIYFNTAIFKFILFAQQTDFIASNVNQSAIDSSSVISGK